jgi:hypothetical protein
MGKGMNRKQKWILGLGTACFSLTGIFPPWVETVRAGKIFTRVALPWTGCSIFGSPSPTSEQFARLTSVEIDISRLAILWILVFILTALAWRGARIPECSAKQG